MNDDELKTEIKTAAAHNPWPLLAGAFVLGVIVGAFVTHIL